MVRRCAEHGYDLLISFQQLSSDWHVDYEDSRKADGIILLGEAASLPWVDGVSYLGSDERAPHLLLPTNREPNVPLDLLQQALIERSSFPPTLALIETRNTVVSLALARELSRDVLRSRLSSAT